jgi:HSP20 family protein
MKALVPFGNLRKEMDRLLDRFGDWELPELPGMADWSPSLDLAETKDGFAVKVEIPGMEPGDIHVALDNQMLTIKGEKKQEKESKDEHYYRMERSYGAFARTVRLPAAVDGSKVTAGFKNGVLTVALPKAPGAKGTQIPVKAE